MFLKGDVVATDRPFIPPVQKTAFQIKKATQPVEAPNALIATQPVEAPSVTTEM